MSTFGIIVLLHYKNKIVEITNLLVSTVIRNSNLIVLVGCYDCMVTYMYLY